MSRSNHATPGARATLARMLSTTLMAAAGACLLTVPGLAAGHGHGKGPPIGGGGTTCGVTSSVTSPDGSTNDTYCWMSPDVGAAWAAGYLGHGVSMTFVDDFSNSSPFSGNLGTGTQTQGHGFWTTEEGGMVAPEATIYHDDFSTEVPITLQSGSLNVVNASYGLVGKASFYSNAFDWSAYPQEQSMIDAANAGTAVISKAAGNDGVAVGTSIKGKLDYLDAGLIGAQSALFVGALDHNGTTHNQASLASYSDYAGSNVEVQSHFLVVGVEGDKTGLYGTSFAAPVISGYSAILGSKFTSASPTQIANRLLDTARTDTVVNYNAATYGRGEASLTNALAPNSIQ